MSAALLISMIVELLSWNFYCISIGISITQCVSLEFILSAYIIKLISLLLPNVLFTWTIYVKQIIHIQTCKQIINITKYSKNGIYYVKTLGYNRLGKIVKFISVFFFSSPDPKVHVRYYHHLASVVRPLTFHILIYSSETTGPIGTKLGRKHLYKVLYKVSSFRPTQPTNMAAKGNSCFRLANVKKIFSSETAWPNGAKLGRKHLCKILYKTSSFGSIRPTNMATVTENRTW